jgi:hypothetical protein
MLAAEDSRIKAVTALDPINGGGPPCFIDPYNCALYPAAPNPARGQAGVLSSIQAASLILRSNPDPAFAPEEEFNAYWFFYGADGAGYGGVPAPAVYFDMGKVGHATYLPAVGGRTVQVAKRSAAAWFDHYLRGRNTVEYFDGVIADQDVALGRIKQIDRRY